MIFYFFISFFSADLHEFFFSSFLGKSPSSSESTTPEALSPSAVPPLHPIKEGQSVVGCSATHRDNSPVETTAL